MGLSRRALLKLLGVAGVATAVPLKPQHEEVVTELPIFDPQEQVPEYIASGWISGPMTFAVSISEDNDQWRPSPGDLFTVNHKGQAAVWRPGNRAAGRVIYYDRDKKKIGAVI